MLPAACCIHPHQQRRTLRTKPVNPTTPQVDKHGKKVVTRTIESMPFQAYQLALEVIREDRAEIQQQIRRTSDRLTKALAVPDVDPKARHILSLKRHLHKLRIEIDMNNPRVKYNFDNGISELLLYLQIDILAQFHIPCRLILVTEWNSWHKQTRISAPPRTQMARTSPPDTHATSQPNARHPRHHPIHRARRRRTDTFPGPRSQTWDYPLYTPHGAPTYSKDRPI